MARILLRRLPPWVSRLAGLEPAGPRARPDPPLRRFHPSQGRGPAKTAPSPEPERILPRRAPPYPALPSTPLRDRGRARWRVGPAEAASGGRFGKGGYRWPSNRGRQEGETPARVALHRPNGLVVPPPLFAPRCPRAPPVEFRRAPLPARPSAAIGRTRRSRCKAEQPADRQLREPFPAWRVSAGARLCLPG